MRPGDFKSPVSADSTTPAAVRKAKLRRRDWQVVVVAAGTRGREPHEAVCLARENVVDLPLMKKAASLIVAERIESMILLIRGEKVMLDEALAKLYGTTTRRLNEQVRRNRKRFPPDFMFELTDQEVRNLKSQSATSSTWGGRRRSRPFAFTEQGVAMLSSVLNSERAIEVNILIMRSFVKLRQLLATHVALAKKLDALERKYDTQFRVVFDAIRELMKPTEPKKRPIGFRKD